MWPAPDGTLSQADRQHIAFLYSGILAGAVVAGVAEICLKNLSLKASVLQSGSVLISEVRNVLVRSSEIRSLNQKC